MRSLFSSRLSSSLSPNALSQLLEEKRQAGARILDLTESNPTRAGFDYPSEEILASLADPDALLYEPSPRGLRKAREEIAGYYAERGLSVDPEDIFLTTSTSEAYGHLFKLLADPGERVLVPQPSYPLFELLAQLESVAALAYPLRYDAGWRMDLEALSSLREGARAIVVVSPNNPTGSYLKQDELFALRTSLLPTIADEVFGDYPLSSDRERVASLVEEPTLPGFVLSGFSKILGLPQLKLGWIVVFGPSSFRREAGERLELCLDTYLSVGTSIQHAAGRLLSLRDSLQHQITRRIAGNRRFLEGALGPASPCNVLRAEGGWSAILRVPASRTEEEWVLALLQEDEVLIHPGYFFDFESEAFLVMSLLTAEATFQEGVKRILARVERSQGE